MAYSPEFTFEQLNIPPVNLQRRTIVDGEVRWENIERNITPTGIPIIDRFLLFLSRGRSDRREFYEREGLAEPPCRQQSYEVGEMRRANGSHQININHFYATFFFLTGFTVQDFHNRYSLRTADLLLCLTDSTIDAIAHASGAINASNLARLYKRFYQCSPTERREALRQSGEMRELRIAQ